MPRVEAQAQREKGKKKREMPPCGPCAAGPIFQSSQSAPLLLPSFSSSSEPFLTPTYGWPTAQIYLLSLLPRQIPNRGPPRSSSLGTPSPPLHPLRLSAWDKGPAPHSSSLLPPTLGLFKLILVAQRLLWPMATHSPAIITPNISSWPNSWIFLLWGTPS